MVVGEGGRVQASKRLSVSSSSSSSSDAGREEVLHVDALSGFKTTGDVDLSGHSLLNAKISGSSLEGVQELQVTSISITGAAAAAASAAAAAEGRLAVLGPDGKLGGGGVQVRGGVLSATGEGGGEGGGQLQLGGVRATGPVDFNHQPLTNVAIKSASSIKGVGLLRTSRLQLTPGQGQGGGGGDEEDAVDVAAAAAREGKVLVLGPGGVEVTAGEGLVLSREGQLRVTSLRVEGQKRGRLAVFDEGGVVEGTNAVRVTDGTLTAPKLGGFTATGPVDFNHQPLTNVAIKGGEVTGLSALATSRLTLTEAGAGGGGEDGSLAVIGRSGRLQASGESVASVQSGRLRVTSLQLPQAAAAAGGAGSGSGSLLRLGADSVVEAVTGVSVTDGTLTAPKLGGFTATGPVDFNHQPLTNVAIKGGSVEGLKALGVDGTASATELAVAGDAFVEGSLTVGGSVMGSGPYVDSSDLRLKKDVQGLHPHHASTTLQQLRAVTYEWRSDEFHNRTHLATKPAGARELGFIAQEVEAVVPDLVHTDEDGWKYVAYARFTPLLVEAVKEQGVELGASAQAVAELQQETDRLRRENEALRAALEASEERTSRRLAALEAALLQQATGGDTQTTQQ